MITHSDPDLRDQPDLPLGKLIAGAAIGALAMYLLDPERGASRRAAVSGKLREASRGTTQAVTDAVQDLAHRAGAADVFHATDSDLVGTHGAAPRQPIGRLLDEFLSRPVDGARALARSLRERTHEADTRSAVMWGGGALGLFGLLARRSPLALAVGLAGAALLASGARRHPLGSLLSGRRVDSPAEIEKTIRIDASPEQVYDLWAKVENFPRFMANVAEVRDLGANLSHWVVRGPAGTSYEWHSLLTEQSRPHRLAWRSIPGGDIDQRGEVHFEPIRGGTRATVRLSYTPPGGGAGQAVATLLGSNPKAQLEEDLQRMKNLLEKGSLMHAAAHLGGSDSKFLH